MQEDRVSSISKARTLEEMADFWDTHSLADYDEQTHEVEMTFDLCRAADGGEHRAGVDGRHIKVSAEAEG